MWSGNTSVSQDGFSHSSNAPKPFPSGICVGRGRGFGNLGDVRNALPQVGSSFNNSRNTSLPSDDDNWGDAPETTGEHSNNSWKDNSGTSWQPQSSNNQSSGWGSDNNRNKFDSRSDSAGNTWQGKKSNNSSGWDDESDNIGGGDGNKDRWSRSGQDSVIRGGGFENRQRRDRGSGCFNCGEDGHVSRDCPNPSNKPKKGCYNCGEDGHMSRDCPKPSDKPKRGCYNCGEDGHMSRDCSKSSDKPKKGCFNCGEDGHISRECPNQKSDGKQRAAPYVPPELPEDEHSLFTVASTGINFSKYDSIPVEVTGNDVPNGIELFEDAKFLPLIAKNIKRYGYDKPTPIQKRAIPIILRGRDLMACAQTGSGKTAAFLLPIIQHMCASDLPNTFGMDVQEPWAVIVSPTRELAIQIYNEAKKFSFDSIVKAEVVYGGTSVGYQSSRIKKGCHILVATPGRLLDFVEKGKVSFSQVKYFILDEADRMLDMGFMPAIRQMVDDSSMPPKERRNTLMFSATFPVEIQELAKDFLCDYLFLTVGVVGAANTDVEQTFFSLGQYEKRQKLMDILNESGTDRTLVFVEQKRTADFIASFASQNNIPTTSIHGDRLQKEREEALSDFRRGKMPVLVATAVAARGLDIKDVRHVINYDLPQSIDEYVHRIGRTGRVGNVGKATSFYDPGVDQPLARSLKKILLDANQPIPEWLSEEANQAIGTVPQAGGRGNFGSRDMRNKGRFNQKDASSSWDNNFSTTGSSGFNDTVSPVSQPLDVEDDWN